MADFFDHLRRPTSPHRPDPAFAATLRLRVEEELGMSAPTPPTVTTDKAIDLGILHVKVPDADRALAFFSDLLDWQSDPFRDAGHTAHYIVNTELLTVLTDDPDAAGVRLYFAVTDVDAAAASLVALGGSVGNAEITADGGGWVEGDDGQGTAIGLWRRGHDHPVTQELRTPRGHVGYLTLHVADGARAAALYNRLLGWHFDEPRPNGYRHVSGSNPSIGVYGDHDEPSVSLYVKVADLDDVVARVPVLGGSVSEPAGSPSGRSARCTDDQGTVFYLWEPAPGY